MLKIEKFVTMSPEQWDIVIEGMRNPKNSWERSDSFVCKETHENADAECDACPLTHCNIFDHEPHYIVGRNDHQLMESLVKGGPVHAKFRRMMPVWVNITAPLYWWKEFDTYKVGTVSNSCSTMHKIHAKEFTLEDFSHEHMRPRTLKRLMDDIEELNFWRDIYLNGGMVDNNDGTAEVFKPYDMDAWRQMIQLLGSNYNQKRTIFLGYEVLANVRLWRCHHKLTEWHTLCDWIEELPYSEIITGEFEDSEN